MSLTFDRAESFCRRFGLRVPILLAPMAGACSPTLSIAVANAGGLGACGAEPAGQVVHQLWEGARVLLA
jgi:nitronate monooxygenase